VTGHLNQQYLHERVAADANVPIEVAKRVVESYQDVILRALIAGESVRQTNFMSLHVVERNERQAHNPQTGEKVTVPATKTVKVTVLPRVLELVRTGTMEIDGQLVTTRKLPKGAKGIVPVVTADPRVKKPRVRVAKPRPKKRVSARKTA
jgi:DNA-binding protein HU-beta